jgi:CspA family cold shock protein
MRAFRGQTRASVSTDLSGNLPVGETKLLLGVRRMSEGTIKRLTDKGFGFIANGTGTDMFFHMSAVEGVRFEELREGQKVSYNEGRGPKGPRAENVRVI